MQRTPFQGPGEPQRLHIQLLSWSPRGVCPECPPRITVAVVPFWSMLTTCQSSFRWRRSPTSKVSALCVNSARSSALRCPLSTASSIICSLLILLACCRAFSAFLPAFSRKWTIIGAGLGIVPGIGPASNALLILLACCRAFSAFLPAFSRKWTIIGAGLGIVPPFLRLHPACAGTQFSKLFTENSSAKPNSLFHASSFDGSSVKSRSGIM